MNETLRKKDLCQDNKDRNTVRLKDLGTLQNGISKGKDYFGEGFPFVSYGNVYNDSIQLEKIKTLANSTIEDQKQYSVQEGDVFFTRTSETIDEIGISATAQTTIPNATFSGFVIRLRPNKRLIKKEYSKYFFKADVNRQFLSREINLVTRASLSQNTLSNLPVILPTFNEQTAIAEYLDTKTQAIDKKVNLLEKKIGCYQELCKSLINETVTKGLDKNVKLKDSGVDWIGQIPEHWEVKRGKDIFKEISRKNRPDLPLLAASQKQGVVLKSMLENRSMEAQKSFEIFKWVKPKDFVISLRSFEGGIETAFYEGIISPAYTVFNFRTNGNITSYFTYLFKSACFIDFLQSSITGIRDGQSVKFIELERAFFAIPPVSEQIPIADYLMEKTSKIDQIITNTQTQIITLQELRKTLINDVVTGKIKVIQD